MAQIQITASGNTFEATATLENIPAQLKKAAQSAVKKTFNEMRQLAVQKIVQRYIIGAGDVKKTMTVRVSGLSGTLRFVGRRPGLQHFKINPRSRLKRPPVAGIFAQVLRSGGGDYLRRAFIAKGNLVFERLGKSRLPISKLTGPAAPQMAGHNTISTFIQNKMAERLSANFGAGL